MTRTMIRRRATAPAVSEPNSLTLGAIGPILLHDVQYIEQTAHFKPRTCTRAKPACQRL
jgi:catalase